jgi:DNA processing protein
MQTKDIINISVQDYPEELNQLHKVPSRLYSRGNISLLKRKPRVGIVGARKFTPYGREVTANISHNLARAGVTVVSGLALGVDSIAHKACLEAGGSTIAVLPSGVEKIYPATHAALATQIVEQNGLLITEYAGRDIPRKNHFIERNRIIAALSDVLIITEAAEASGSLHTARFALELGKTIMAVPGQITSPYSAGTNQLIVRGATPLLHPDDVLQELGLTPSDNIEYIPENEAEAAILASLKKGITLGDDLLKSSKLDTSVYQTHLTMLEIKGVIEVTAGRWCIK